MQPLVTFEFNASDSLLPRENVAYFEKDGLVVRLFRQMRTTPMVEMKQPLLHHAIMGLETIIAITDNGQVANGYRWKLYKRLKLVQRGIIDESGCCGDVRIDLDSTERYRLVVYRKKPRKASPLASV